MARIKYGELAEAIRTVIEQDREVQKAQATVICAQPPVMGSSAMPYICVFERARTSAWGQTLAAGTRRRYQLNWEVWITTVSGNGFADAVSQRDDLLGYVEIALMKNRTLGGKLADASLMIHGGDLRSGPGGVGFVAEGSITVSAEAEASTT